MSFVRTVDEIEKLGAPVVVLTMVLTFATMAFLLVRETTAPFAVTAPTVVPSHEAAEDEVRSVPVAALPAPAMPRPETSPAPPPGVPRAPREPSPGAGEQRVFKSRKALETIDARELLRRAELPK